MLKLGASKSLLLTPSRHPGGNHRSSQSSLVESKESKENGIISRSVTPIPSRPSTPKPHYGTDHHSNFRSGMLTIRIFSGQVILGMYVYLALMRISSPHRSRAVSCARRSSTRRYPKGVGLHASQEVHQQSRERTTQTLLVVALCRP